MAITDLTGTIWYVPSGWITTSKQATYSVNGYAPGVAVTDNTFTSIKLGYKSSSTGLANAIYFSGGSGIYLGSYQSFRIVITGGADVKNSSLISWLETNGTMLKVTDLTNTTWNVKAGWSASSGFGKFSITGSYSYTWISSGNSYSYEIKNDYTLDNERSNLIIGYDYDGFKLSQKSNCICVYEAYSNGNNGFQTFPNSNAVNFTITFTGGTDATNTSLIAWLSENGELQEQKKTIKAGTYRFNDTITAIGNDSGYGNVITDFYLPDKGYECTEIRVFYDSTVQYVEDGGQIRTPYDSANGGWVYGDTWKTIVIYDDTEVDDTFGTWFTSNTTMLIKAGPYRWNDVPTLPNTELIQDNFNFIVPPHTFTITQEMADSFNNIIGSFPELVAYFGVAEEGTYTVNCSCTGITAKPDNFIVYRARKVSITPDTTLLPELFENVNAYTYNEGWDTPSTLFSLLGVSTPEGWDTVLDYTYQFITIPEDQYVPTTFGLWANENWKPYSEGVKKKFTRLYIGDTVATAGNKCFKRLTTEEPSTEITDLTGTTWYVPSGWSATAGYGQFVVEGTYIEDNYTYNMLGIRLGYMTPTATYADAFCVMTSNGSYRNVYSTTSVVFNITGGTDATNADLIAWLYANGELQ